MLSTPVFEVVAYGEHAKVVWALRFHLTRPVFRFRVFENRIFGLTPPFSNAQRHATRSFLALWKTRHLVVTDSHEIFVLFETPGRFRHGIVFGRLVRGGGDSFVRETQWPRSAKISRDQPRSWDRLSHIKLVFGGASPGVGHMTIDFC
jgi:hypothetical protein